MVPEAERSSLLTWCSLDTRTRHDVDAPGFKTWKPQVFCRRGGDAALVQSSPGEDTDSDRSSAASHDDEPRIQSP